MPNRPLRDKWDYPRKMERHFPLKPRQTIRNSSCHFLSFPNSLIRAKNRFVKDGTANFDRNIPTEISGPPPKVIPNIPVGRNQTIVSMPKRTFLEFRNFRKLWLKPMASTEKVGAVAARATFDCAGAKIFFVLSIFGDHAVLCAVKSDKRKFKDKPFINRWSASQIKHITAKSNSKLRQKILFDIDYQSFAVVACHFVSRCRRSRWRFFCNEYLASTLSSHF